MNCSAMNYTANYCSEMNYSEMNNSVNYCSAMNCDPNATRPHRDYTCNTYDSTHMSSHVRLCHRTASTDPRDTPLSGAAGAQAQVEAQVPYAPNAIARLSHYTTNTYDLLDT